MSNNQLQVVEAAYKQMVEQLAIRSLVQFDVFNILPSVSQPGIPLDDIAEHAGLDSAWLQRLLRPLVLRGLLHYDPVTERYRNTTQSATLSSAADVYSMLHDVVYAGGFYLPRWLEGQAGRATACGSHTCPVTEYFHTDSVFDWISQKDMHQTFQSGLSGMSPWRPSLQIFDFSTLASIRDDDLIVFVDIGGADGGFVVELLTAYPSIVPTRIMVQDLAAGIKGARENLSLPSGVRLMEHDFFSPQPIIGAHFYHIRACLHDWDDKRCATILAMIAEAMTDESVLLIAEDLLPDDVATPGLAAYHDMLMLLVGGVERTKCQFQTLLHAAGLHVVRFYSAADTTWSVIEARRTPLNRQNSEKRVMELSDI